MQFATGLNPWIEWARIEVAALLGQEYKLPDTSAYNDPEVVYRLHKHHDAELIVRSESAVRVEQLLEEYGRRFLTDFYAGMDAAHEPSA